MEIKKLTFPDSSEDRQRVLFTFKAHPEVGVNYGTVFLKKGTRIPEKGVSRHPQHEISFIQRGSIKMVDEQDMEIGLLKEGDIIYLQALEPQAGYVLEDTRIIYMLIGKEHEKDQ
ncbi:MAG: hypothetical protein AAF655_25395 [Bacteroidota bacterium]